jgi:chromosome segregation ATPase
MKWIKASEKLPEDISNTKIYFCKFYMLGQLVREETATGAFINSVKNTLRELSPDEVRYISFNEIEYLDESNDEVEQLRTKLAEMTAAHDQYRGMYQKLQRERTVENEQLREDIKVLEDWNEQCSATYDEMLKENESLQSQLNQYREALEAKGMYLTFLTHHYRVLFEFARVHGYEADEKDVRQGEALRNQMSITQQALTPQP